MAQEPNRELLAHLLARVCEHKHRRMHELLDGLGLYQGQPAVLRALWAHEGMTQSELADALERCPATITKMVQRMEKAGFVERKPDPGDERLSRVYLTGTGRNVKTAVENTWRIFEEQAFAGFTAQERDLVRSLLSRVCRNMDNSTLSSEDK
jgi:MarR family transcriptional regulator, organic hydroperoxide resistance regulator